MTSIETLPPNTSQTSAHSGASKRITSHGKQVVLNSDSDSDSMEELDFGLPKPKLELKAPTYTGRPTRRTNLDEPELRKPPREGRKDTKRPFSQLMATAQKNLDAERAIQEHKADLEKVDEEAAPIASALDKDTLKQAIQDGEDSDQADRLYKAMQRTDAVSAPTAYHFFEDVPNVSLISPFPQQSLPNHGWTTCFEESTTRDQAFMSGFAQQIFRFQELPKELVTWIVDEICLSRNTTLDHKYLEILVTHEEQLQKQLSPKRLDIMFKSIGAQVESLDADIEIAPSEAQANTARISLLDVAIGPGPLTVPYMPLISPPASEAGSSPPLAPTPASSEVKEFNKEVDALCQHIKVLGNSIVETGAALDLTILEAKERCERLFWRLQHAVRIGGKKADNVFGDHEDEKQQKVRKFFKPLSGKTTPRESIFDQDGDTEIST
ncbi:hypothetical protein SLS59_005659 [Nothophoma quercina]|uniref:Uncharacterized protein n=1 Tax=Nothophoma quercina TaxID=749835 RepID=A0ABR3R9P4_9PLEO